jgi:hypothetical protein
VRHRLAILTFYVLFVGGAVAAGFYLAPDRPVAQVTPAAAATSTRYTIRLIDCSTVSDRERFRTCREMRESLKKSLKP